MANYDDCASWSGAEGMVQQAIDTFGGLDVLICNAGILRDKMSFNMSEEEFDSVIRVHLKGHFAPIRFAGAYWRAKAKETGEPTNAAIVTTASESGLYGNAGQVNYAAAKAGIASMTIVLARELGRSGVRVNSIAPVAATRLLGTVGSGEDLADNPMMSPDNPAAGAVWLASPLTEGDHRPGAQDQRRRRPDPRRLAPGDPDQLGREVEPAGTGRRSRPAVQGP